MLELKLQYFGHLMRTADSLEKSPMLGKFKGRRRKGRERMRQLDGITNPMDMNLGNLWEIVRDRGPGVLQSMGSQRIRRGWVTEQQFCHQGIKARNGYLCELLEGSFMGP